MSSKGVWGVLSGCPTRVCGVSLWDVLQECVGCPHGMSCKSVWGVLTGCTTRVCGVSSRDVRQGCVGVSSIVPSPRTPSLNNLFVENLFTKRFCRLNIKNINDLTTLSERVIKMTTDDEELATLSLKGSLRGQQMMRSWQHCR
jgi:hypothetical protein